MMMPEEKKMKSGNSFMALLLGAAIGATVGLLWAPRSGQENREALRRRAEQVRDQLRQSGDAAKRAGSQVASGVSDALQNEKSMVDNVASSLDNDDDTTTTGPIRRVP